MAARLHCINESIYLSDRNGVMLLMYNFQKYKILLLYGNRALSKYDNIDVDVIYRELHGWERKVFKLFEHLPLSIEQWLGNWKNSIEEYDVIFVVDGIRGRNVIEYIRARNKRARIVFYYLNPCSSNERKSPKYYQGLGCEFFTFDPQDAKILGIPFKPYYYIYEDALAKYIPVDNRIVHDIFFCGEDKGRLQLINQLHKEFSRWNLRDKMIVVKTPHQRYFGRDTRFLTTQHVPYNDILCEIMQSKAILEIVQPGQRGITMRPMESLFCHKKLITNNLGVRYYDFYDEHNIFILGQRSLQELPAFLEHDYVPVDKGIIAKYDMDNWLESFFA